MRLRKGVTDYRTRKDFGALRSATITPLFGATYPLMPVSIEEMRRMVKELKEPIMAVPQYIAVYDGGLAVFPAPAKDFSMRLVYIPKDRVQ